MGTALASTKELVCEAAAGEAAGGRLGAGEQGLQLRAAKPIAKPSTAVTSHSHEEEACLSEEAVAGPEQVREHVQDGHVQWQSGQVRTIHNSASRAAIGATMSIGTRGATLHFEAKWGNKPAT